MFLFEKAFHNHEFIFTGNRSASRLWLLRHSSYVGRHTMRWCWYLCSQIPMRDWAKTYNREYSFSECQILSWTHSSMAPFNTSPSKNEDNICRKGKIIAAYDRQFIIEHFLLPEMVQFCIEASRQTPLRAEIWTTWMWCLNILRTRTNHVKALKFKTWKKYRWCRWKKIWRHWKSLTTLPSSASRLSPITYHIFFKGVRISSETDMNIMWLFL